MGIESISICNQEVAERNSMGLTGASPVWIVSHHEAGRARSRRRRALSSMDVIGASNHLSERELDQSYGLRVYAGIFTPILAWRHLKQ